MAKNEINENELHQLPYNQTYVPVRINDRQIFAGLETDSFGILILCFVIGNYTQMLDLGIAVGTILVYLNGKAKTNFQRGKLRHLMWWYGLDIPKETKRLPDCYKREFFR